MAFVTEITEATTEHRSRPHSTCTAGWRLSERDGARVLQLDTYGSPQRKDTGTISQSLQLDAERARELVKIIRQAFPSID